MSVTRDETVVGCGALMWAFNLRKKIDQRSQEMIDVPLNKSNSLLIIKPDLFEMEFEPRSGARKEEILKQWKIAEMQENLEKAEFLRKAESREDVSSGVNQSKRNDML